MAQENKNGKPRNNPISQLISWMIEHKVMAFLAVVAIASFSVFGVVTIERITAPEPEELTIEQFESAIEDGSLYEVEYNSTQQEITGTWDPDGDGIYTAYSTPYSMAGLDKLRDTLSEYPSIKFSVYMSSDSFINPTQSMALTLGFLALALLWVGRKIRNEGDGINSSSMSLGNRSVGNSGKKHGKKGDSQIEMPSVTFADVAGCDEALEEVAEVREFLMNPDKFTRFGAKIPCGILMAGPPGCGKTLMARAIAGESGASFFSMSGSDFMEMFVGVGAKRVRELFASARQNAPAIVFIDEIDAIGKKRAASTQMGDAESDRTLNQLLVEMDGFSASDNVIVIGATNRIDTLDPALLRPGRFDRHVMVDLPDKQGRLEILKVHAKNKPLSQNVDLEHYAAITAGMSGAQLENLMNEAAIFAARADAPCIGNDEMNAAFERLVAGAEKKGRVLSDDEKRTTAYHEAGHALVGHMLEGADKVSKISIISRGQALGYTLTLPEDDKFLQRRTHLKDKLAMFLGGLVAEEMVNDDDISTGPSNDLERATQMATAMATRFGMCDELGRRAFVSDSAQSFSKPYSEQTEREIDEAVGALMDEAHDRARLLLTEYRDRLDQIAEVLVAQEVVEGAEMEDLLDGCWKGTGAYETLHFDYVPPADAQKRSVEEVADEPEEDGEGMREAVGNGVGALRERFARHRKAAL